jgi:integration host factor subunit beta
MKKSELIEKLALRQGLPQRDAALSVDLILEAIADGLSRGERTEIRGFGAFDVHWRPEKIGRNPKTGESVQVPSKRTLRFKAGKELRAMVDGKAVEQLS